MLLSFHTPQIKYNVHKFVLLWTHISVTLSYRIFSALFKTANTTSKMPLLILSLYNLYSTPYCELMDTSCRTTSILKGNSPKQSTMWQCKHTWREHDKSKIGFTYFWRVAPGCPSQQRGHAVHAAIGRKRGWFLPATGSRITNQLLCAGRGASRLGVLCTRGHSVSPARTGTQPRVRRAQGLPSSNLNTSQWRTAEKTGIALPFYSLSCCWCPATLKRHRHSKPLQSCF